MDTGTGNERYNSGQVTRRVRRLLEAFTISSRMQPLAYQTGANFCLGVLDYKEVAILCLTVVSSFLCWQ